VADVFVTPAPGEKNRPVDVGGREYPVRVKTSTASGRLIAEKPEYDGLAANRAGTGHSPPVCG
jgi:hypothetical protein